MLRVLDTCGHVGYLPHSKAGNRLHYLGQLPQENAAETLVVALLSQISDLDEERVMTILPVKEFVERRFKKDGREVKVVLKEVDVANPSGYAAKEAKRRCSMR